MLEQNGEELRDAVRVCEHVEQAEYFFWTIRRCPLIGTHALIIVNAFKVRVGEATWRGAVHVDFVNLVLAIVYRLVVL